MAQCRTHLWKNRNVAWRVLDAKYFGLPQQRRRLYVVADGKDFNPENILFEIHKNDFSEYPTFELVFQKDGHDFEVFREYTDRLCSAYGQNGTEIQQHIMAHCLLFRIRELEGCHRLKHKG